MSVKRGGLGRNLSALLSQNAVPVQASSTSVPEQHTLPITSLQPGKYQPRGDFDEVALTELADSIKKQGLIQPLVVRTIAPQQYEIIAGTFVIGRLSNHMSMILFGCFLLIIAVLLLLKKQPKTEVWTPALLRDTQDNLLKRIGKELMLSLFALIIGLLSSMFGIGGGLLMVPGFLFLGLSMHTSSGTAATCGVPIAIIGTIALTLSGSATINLSSVDIPNGTWGYVYWPAVSFIAMFSIFFAPIGTRAAIWCNAITLRKILACLLILTAIDLFAITK